MIIQDCERNGDRKRRRDEGSLPEKPEGSGEEGIELCRPLVFLPPALTQPVLLTL